MERIQYNMIQEKSCGAIVCRRHHGNLEILLIKHINSGHWSFPKGHVEEGESETETAAREVRELWAQILQTVNQNSLLYGDRTSPHDDVMARLLKGKG